MKPEVLLRAVDAVVQYSQNFDMNYWVTHCDTKAECGTAGCLAAWICATNMTSTPEEAKEKLKRLFSCDVVYYAVEVAELTPTQTRKLFHVYNWPIEFQEKFISAENRAEDALVLKEYVTWFIAKETHETKQVG